MTQWNNVKSKNVSFVFYVGLHVNVSWKYIRLHDVAWNVPGDCLFIVFCHLSYVNKFAPSFFTYFNAQKHEEMHQHYIILELKLFLYKFKMIVLFYA